MLWTVRVTCISGPHYDTECIRFIEIEPAASLYDLHVAIQDAVHFDDLLDFTLFRATSPGGKREYIPEGLDPRDDYDIDLYEDLNLAEALECEGRERLFYVYDVDNEWLFEISKEPVNKEADPSEYYPLVLEEVGIGPDPLQYGVPLDDFADDDEAAEHRAMHLRQVYSDYLDSDLEEGEDDEDEDDEDTGEYRQIFNSLFNIDEDDDDEDDDDDDYDYGFGNDDEDGDDDDEEW